MYNLLFEFIHLSVTHIYFDKETFDAQIEQMDEIQNLNVCREIQSDNLNLQRYEFRSDIEKYKYFHREDIPFLKKLLNDSGECKLNFLTK